MAASHKLKGDEAGLEADSRLWPWVGFSSLPPSLPSFPVPLRADPRAQSLAHCHSWSILRSPSAPLASIIISCPDELDLALLEAFSHSLGHQFPFRPAA